jgi:hypothetical protein
MWMKTVLVRAGRVARVVEHLPSKCEALSSKPSTDKKKKKKEEGKWSWLEANGT